MERSEFMAKYGDITVFPMTNTQGQLVYTGISLDGTCVELHVDGIVYNVRPALAKSLDCFYGEACGRDGSYEIFLYGG